MNKTDEESADALVYASWLACGYQPIRDEKRETMRRTFETLPLPVPSLRMSSWECVNMYGAIVYDCLFENEARLIAAQHGLKARNDDRKSRVMDQLEADRYYAEMAERMKERAPA